MAFAEKMASIMGYSTHGSDVVTRQMLEDALSVSGFKLNRLGYQGWLPENGLPRWPIFLANQILSRIPIIRKFSHDFYFVATRRDAAI
jgi:hypothetical protein